MIRAFVTAPQVRYASRERCEAMSPRLQRFPFIPSHLNKPLVFMTSSSSGMWGSLPVIRRYHRRRWSEISIGRDSMHRQKTWCRLAIQILSFFRLIIPGFSWTWSIWQITLQRCMYGCYFVYSMYMVWRLLDTHIQDMLAAGALRIGKL
jgi:hypothetical protein